MEIAEVQDLIKAALPDSEVIVSGEGCSFTLVVVSESFAGLNTVKRQQRVLAAVSEPLSTGALHAVSMKVYTPDEWRSAQAAAG
ncbi:BolA/IbaG family iron-sulfur metabolism protein [Methylolobus aquaticus]|nr:BolA/IbaG family iron-sulfur metabolism protein [Methylolobus aquaticus]